MRDLNTQELGFVYGAGGRGCYTPPPPCSCSPSTKGHGSKSKGSKSKGSKSKGSKSKGSRGC
jgi:hypothetical protein